jgi:type IV secretory pathway VirB9-like protein
LIVWHRPSDGHCPSRERPALRFRPGRRLRDTVRWIIGVTESGTGESKKIHVLAKPTRLELTTNLVINTDRRTYLLDLRSTENTYMASASWQLPEDHTIALTGRM